MSARTARIITKPKQGKKSVAELNIAKLKVSYSKVFKILYCFYCLFGKNYSTKFDFINIYV